jgi:hypothetical protein
MTRTMMTRRTITEAIQHPMTLFAFIGLVGALLIAVVAPVQSQQSQVGVAAAVRGSVQVQSGGAARAPSGGEAMLLGDRVVTQRQSGMQVLLLDESVFTIGESNDLVIDRFVYDPDRSVGEIAARSTQGFLRFVSGGVGAIAPQNVSIETPSATIGSRGTSFDVVVGAEAVALAQAAGMIPPGTVVDPATAVFVVLRGPSTSYGGITQRGRVIVQTAGGSVEIRRQGFGVFVPAAGAPPIGPAPVPGTVQSQIIASIELPSVGTTRTVNGVTLTELPSIDTLPIDLFPGPNGNNPDVTGPGFDYPCNKMKDHVAPKQIGPSMSDPCNPGTGGGGTGSYP